MPVDTYEDTYTEAYGIAALPSPPFVTDSQVDLRTGNMHNYRYLICDLLTNEVNLEVPCYGVSYGREINKASDGTFSINLDRTDYSNQDVIDATVPGKTVMYIDRGGKLIWGGIVWSRTYQAQAKVLSYTMQTFESFFYKCVISPSLLYTDRDQRNILCELLLDAQQGNQTDLGVTLPTGYPFTGGTIRSVNFYKYDNWTYGKAFDYLAEYDEGLDWTIDVYYDGNGVPRKRLLVDDMLGAESIVNKGLVFEYPGNISNYYWPENASRGAVTMYGVGAGEGTAQLRTSWENADLLLAGFPNLQDIYINQDVSIAATLLTQTRQAADLARIPITVPTIQIDPDKEPQIGSWAIGDTARLVIQDPRFPEGKDTSVRILGYTAAPPSSDGAEQCQLIIAGADDV